MRNMILQNKILTLFALLAVLYVLACATMWAWQRHLMYIPHRGAITPAQVELTDFSDVRFTTADGVSLQAWVHTAKPGWPTIVYFHGNGGNLSHRAQYYHFLAEAGFGMVALSYRGYGASEGTPSEAGLYADGRAAMDYAQNMLKVSPDKLILYGESLGTGVAIQLATERQVGGVILQSPYTSIAERAKYFYPWLPIDLLLKDRFDSIDKIARVHAPVLILHGERDTLVPVSDARALFSAANEPKQAVYFPSAGHYDLDLEALEETVVKFSRAQGLVE